MENVIVMNPKNGDILAMASYPDYDLNSPYTPNATLAKHMILFLVKKKVKLFIKCGQINQLQTHTNLVQYLR